MGYSSAIALLLSFLFLGGWLVEWRKRKKAQRLLRDVSHDLKTPVATLYLYAQILEKSMNKEPHNEENLEHIKDIFTEVGKLNDMIALLSGDSPRKDEKR